MNTFSIALNNQKSRKYQIIKTKETDLHGLFFIKQKILTNP